MRTRPNQIIIRMTEEEYLSYKDRLEKSNLKGNDFGIRCLLDHSINVVPGTLEMIRSLKAIGNNLNQIAKAVNGDYLPGRNTISELERGVTELWQLLKLPYVTKANRHRR